MGRADGATACLESHPSWITRNKLQRELLFEPENKLLMDLDEIPVYDLDVLVFPDVYFMSSDYLFTFNPPADSKEIILFTTRGCPYHCVFCASHGVHGYRVRYYSLERMQNDIDYYHQRYGITRFVFFDDNFFIDKSRAVAILDHVAMKGLTADNVTPAFFFIDRDVVAAMKRVGVTNVCLTIESGNEHTLKKIMRKPSNLAQARRAIDILHELGIIVVSNILIGVPGETKESIEFGLENLKKMNANWFMCFAAAPLPGSELYQICEDNDYFVTDDDPITTMDFKRCVIRTPDFDPEYIERKCYEMNLVLNFTNNYDFRTGNYQGALSLFERVLHAWKEHAFAHYFAARCCWKLGLTEKYATYKAAYEDSIAKYPFWADYAKQHQLSPLD